MSCPEGSAETPNITTNLKENLHLSFTKTCERFVSHIKFSLMKKTLRAIYNDNPELLKTIHDQLCSQLKNVILLELNEYCEEQGIDYLLDLLEKLKESQDISQPSWRPTGDPEEDIRDHIYPCKQQLKEEYQNILAKLQFSNEQLFNTVSVQHAEILHLKSVNDDLYKSFSDIMSSLMGTNLKYLKQTLSDAMEEA